MKKYLLILALFAFLGETKAQSYLGEVILFGGNFCPRDYEKCDGQVLAINSSQALFSLLGTTYGGDGRTTFNLPDLRGRLPIHVGHGAGLTNRPLGSKGGSENEFLTIQQIPGHSHVVKGTTELANQASPVGKTFAKTEEDNYALGNLIGGIPTSNTGEGQTHENRSPYNTIHYCMCITGIFPPRN